MWLGGVWLGESEGVVCSCLMNDNSWGRPFNLEPEKGLASESGSSGHCVQVLSVCSHARVHARTHAGIVVL